jgi:hypothetical protein
MVRTCYRLLLLLLVLSRCLCCCLCCCHCGGFLLPMDIRKPPQFCLLFRCCQLEQQTIGFHQQPLIQHTPHILATCQCCLQIPFAPHSSTCYCCFQSCSCRSYSLQPLQDLASILHANAGLYATRQQLLYLYQQLCLLFWALALCCLL